MKKVIFLVLLSGCATSPKTELRGTGDLGVIIARATGEVSVVNTTSQEQLQVIGGLGDLSHASLVYSRDARYAYIFGRDGGLTKIDLLLGKIEKRIIQAGNAIGGAISQDGSLVAVSNYEPGGVRIFRSTDLEMLADIPTLNGNGTKSKTVGLIDLPGQKFGVSLFEGGEIWILDCSQNPANPQITKFKNAGREPYDALISPEGRYYVAGLFGEDGLALVDLWNLDKGVRKILPNYGRGKQKLPVYKMPHLQGWAMNGNFAFIPAVGLHEILVVNMQTWKEVKKIPVAGQPVFAIASPDTRHVWVNFALPDNDKVQLIDTQSLKVTKTLTPGKGVLHMEFTPKGEAVWLSLRDEDRVDILRTSDLTRIGSLNVKSPSGIFFTPRAHRIGL